MGREAGGSFHIGAMTKAKDLKPARPKRAGPAARTNPTTGGFQISDELWGVLEPLIPQRVNTHRFGGGRPRVPNRHLRFQEWVAAGVFLELWRVGLERYDELKGLDWSWLNIDVTMSKAPWAGENPAPTATT